MVENKSTIVGEFVKEDPGKASELIQRFNSIPATANEKKKERREVNRISEDRLKFLKKPDEELSDKTAAPSRGQKPGAGDQKWLRKLEAEEARRSSAVSKSCTTDDIVSRLRQELQNAGLECTERSRLLSDIREKYQILTKQLSELQDMLGIANSAKAQLAQSERRAQREMETEEEAKRRDLEEKETLKVQAIEMRNKLNQLVASDKQRVALEEELAHLKAQFKVREDEALDELSRLTAVVKDLTSKCESREAKETFMESRILELTEQLDRQTSTIAERDIDIKNLRTEIERLICEADACMKGAEVSRVELNEKLEERDAEVNALKESLYQRRCESESSAVQLTERNEKLKHDISELMNTLQTRDDEISKVTMELNKREVSEMELRNELLSASNAKLKCDETIDELRKDIATYKKKLSDNEAAMSLKEEVILAVKGDVESLTDKLSLEQERCATAETSLSHVRREAADIQSEILSLTEEVQLHNEREEKWEDEKKSYEALVSGLKEQLCSIESEREQSTVLHKAEIDVLRAEILEKMNLIAELGRSIENLNALNVKESEERVNELRSLKEEYVISSEKLATESEAKIADLNNVINDLKMTKAENERLLNAKSEAERMESETRYQTCLTELNHVTEERDRVKDELEEASKKLSYEHEEKNLVAATNRALEDRTLKLESSNEEMKSKLILSSCQIEEKEVAYQTLIAAHESELLALSNLQDDDLRKFVDDELRKRHHDSKQKQSVVTYRNAETNVLRVEMSSLQDGSELKSLDNANGSNLLIVEGIDSDDTATGCRGPSLQSYVDTLNEYRKKIEDRDQKFLTRLDKVRELEGRLRRREVQLGDRIERVKTKESHLFKVVKTMKEREAELRSVSQSFEKFRARLQNSCWDSNGDELNRSLDAPGPDESALFNTLCGKASDDDDDSCQGTISSIADAKGQENVEQC